MKKEIILIVGMIILMLIANNYTTKAVEDCVNAGHTRFYCEKGLK